MSGLINYQCYEHDALRGAYTRAAVLRQTAAKVARDSCSLLQQQAIPKAYYTTSGVALHMACSDIMLSFEMHVRIINIMNMDSADGPCTVCGMLGFVSAL